MTEVDPLESLLSLEDQFHAEGHALGVSDGSKAGRVEGRTFGLERGLAKFGEMGRLGGRAAVWHARLQSPAVSERTGAEVEGLHRLPPLSGSDRLRRHVARLAELTDAEGLATENSEDAVAEFDERLRDARAKTTLIARIAGEDDFGTHANTDDGQVANPTGAVNSGEMEDFRGIARAKVREEGR